MANFDEAFKKLSVKEGGYVNDPRDKGGETYMGICRKYYKNYEMWAIIDKIKKETKTTKELNNKLKENKLLLSYVKDIYKKDYWDKFKLDDAKSEEFAYQVFDSSVNCGIARAVKLLQKTFNMEETGVLSNDLLSKINNF